MKNVLATLALVAAMQATAQAQTPEPPSPIQIQGCSVMQAQRATDNFFAAFGPVVSGAPYADGIRIDYVNHGLVAADRVVFLVKYSGDTQRIVDVGTFTPNVGINRTLGNFSGDRYTGPTPNVCIVTAVRFVDGSVWRAPTP